MQVVVTPDLTPGPVDATADHFLVVDRNQFDDPIDPPTTSNSPTEQVGFFSLQ